MTPKQQVKEIIAHFNFSRVLTMMRAVNWKHNDKPVTLEGIKMCAVLQLQTLLQDKEISSSRNGGFIASRGSDELGHEYFQLEFVGEYWDTEGL